MACCDDCVCGTATDATERVLDEIRRERLRQETLKAEGRFRYTLADSPGLSDGEKLACLQEELGEAAREVLRSRGLTFNDEPGDLRKELIQVATLAAAWAEAL